VAYERSEIVVPGSRSEVLVADFLRGVYGWMCGGLAITAVTAFFVANSPTLVKAIYTNKLLFWALIIAQFGIVITLSGRVNRLAASTASALFIAYSALTGVTLSFILLLYTAESIASTFVVCAGMFGGLALYGSTTKRNLSGFGQFMFMGLIGVVIASIIGLFWQNDGLQFMISIIGVIVFAGLTVWDAQRLKGLALANAGGTSSVTIVGALSLYLNFINLFLFLLRFMGGRRR
jgi:FtsH-binding integral membrane protein